MPDVTPFLWFDDQAEDAAGRYVAIFGGAVRSRGAGVRFDILGREYVAFNGGPHFRLTPTFSLMVPVQTQAVAMRVARRPVRALVADRAGLPRRLARERRRGEIRAPT